MDAAKSVTADYVVQYKLTLATDPVAVGVSSISGGSNGAFYDAGTMLTLEAAYPVPVNAGSPDRFDHWSGDLAGTTNPQVLLMSAPRSVMANYVKQFNVTFTQSGIGGDTGSNTVGTIGGSAKAAAGLPLTDWFDDGTTWSFESLVQTDPASGKRYSLTSAASGTISAAATITGTYATQYRLNLATDPTAVGTSNISGAADGSWHDAGASVTLTATTPVPINATSRYRFDHWSGGASGTANPVTFTMSAPKTVTANYVVQYLLSLATDPAAVGVGNIGGATDGSWHDAGTTVTLTATTPVPINGTSRYRFDHWSGDASGTTTSVGVLMDAPKSVTADYVVQYKLTLATDPVAVGVSNISGGSNGAFYDAGTMLTLEAANPVPINAGSQYRFDHWSGDLAGTTNPQGLLLSAPRSVMANYVKQFDVTFTQSGIGGDTGSNTVGTIGGSAKAAGGLPLTDWFDDGTTWSFESLVQTDPASGKRYSLTSAASGTISAAATITGTYATQYRLNLATDPTAVGTSNISGAADGSWHDAGASVTLTATTPVPINATSRYRFDHWSGGASGTANPVTFTMSAPKTVTANYVVQYLLSFGQSGITLGTGSNTVVTVDGSAKAASVLPFPKWYDVGATATFAYASPVFTMPASATQYVLSSVTGPTSPSHRERTGNGHRELHDERLLDPVPEAARPDDRWFDRQHGQERPRDSREGPALQGRREAGSVDRRRRRDHRGGRSGLQHDRGRPCRGVRGRRELERQHQPVPLGIGRMDLQPRDDRTRLAGWEVLPARRVHRRSGRDPRLVLHLRALQAGEIAPNTVRPRGAARRPLAYPAGSGTGAAGRRTKIAAAGMTTAIVAPTAIATTPHSV